METSPSSSAITYYEDMAPGYNDPSDSSIGDSVESNNLNSDEIQDSADKQNIKKLFMKVKMDHKLTQKAFDEVIKVNQYALQKMIGSLKNKVCSVMTDQSASPELYQEIYCLFDNSINTMIISSPLFCRINSFQQTFLM